MAQERIKIELLIHDLKSPIAVIEAGVASLLNRKEKYGPLTPEQERVLSRVLRNVKTTRMLVNDSLEIGRSREGIMNIKECRICSLVEQALVELFDLADFNMSERIRDCEDLLGLVNVLKEKGVALQVDKNLWLRELYLDESKVKQILRNLLSNALKYMKSRVELEISHTDGSLLVSVADDGEGIPRTYHQKIFECYFQMKGNSACPVRGHGLGLAGVMVLVEDLDGKLMLESDEGQGARFIVKVPVYNGPQT